MKSRWLAISVALAAFSAGPWTSAQVSDQDKDQPKAGDVQNAPAIPPANLRRRMTAGSSMTEEPPTSMR